MVTAIVLINVERAKVNEVAKQLSSMKGISESYSVSGRYDIIAIVRVSTNDDLADLVTNKMNQINFITKSETMLAYNGYSRHDLEPMFKIGDQ